MLWMFENDVKMYGTQTILMYGLKQNLFENDVKMYGTQTESFDSSPCLWFENDVKMYGTQTMRPVRYIRTGLRMM